jgi:hypothetical protein
MTREYRKKYSHIISRTDYLFLAVSIIWSISAITIPPLFAQSITTIFYGPVLFGGFVIVYGLLISSFFFKFIPNEASEYFRLPDERDLKQSISLLYSVPGISWAGVSVRIGEAEGYYQIHDTTPVARIEGIESALRIVVQNNDQEYSSVMVEPKSDLEMNITPVEMDAAKIRGLVREVLEAYLDLRGSDEFLAEILAELETLSSESDEGASVER